MIVIGFLATLFKFCDYGITNSIEVAYVNACSENWWRNVLYINNFYPEDVFPV